MSTGDPVADRIREAVESSLDGYMSKNQIRRIFHGHLEASRIDAALEKLVALGALCVSSQPTAGRSSTLWSASQEKQLMEMEELPEDDETAKRNTGLIALIALLSHILQKYEPDANGSRFRRPRPISGCPRESLFRSNGRSPE
jgi:hypothetical protein